MRRLGLFLLTLALCATPALVPTSATARGDQPPPMTVLSYNVRAHTSGANLDWNYQWWERREPLAAVVNGRDPDIFGLQEASAVSRGHYSAQWFINKFRPEYNVFRAKRSAVPKLIFFRASRFSIAKYPNGKPMAGQVKFRTLGKCGQPYRTMSWAVLRERHSRTWYWVGNTHFPIGNACWRSRVHAANTIHAHIKRTNPRNFPIILMGDFNNRAVQCIHRNAQTEGRPIARLVEPANFRHRYDLDAARRLDDCTQTLYGNWPGARPRPSRRIDFIFHSRQFNSWSAWVDARRTIQRRYGGKTSPSDHYAVFTRLQVKR